MNIDSPMIEKVDAYVAARRQAGYALRIEAQQLSRFARFTDKSGYRGSLTIEVASRWATASKAGRRLTAARRIEVLRGFARYCQRFDSATEVPPLRLFGTGHRRLTPHIYTDHEIRELLDAAASLLPAGGLRGATCATILGLIAATGLRIGEATRLQRPDVDLQQGLLHIRHGKFGKSRSVPLHPTTTCALQRYVQRRDRDPLSRNTGDFFVFDQGRVASICKIEYAFRCLRTELQWQSRGGHPAPRIHDLRHRFITARLARWYEQGVDVDQRMLALATYVGHAKITDTYWYTTATPDLMALAAQRFEQFRTGGVR